MNEESTASASDDETMRQEIGQILYDCFGNLDGKNRDLRDKLVEVWKNGAITSQNFSGAYQRGRMHALEVAYHIVLRESGYPYQEFPAADHLIFSFGLALGRLACLRDEAAAARVP